MVGGERERAVQEEAVKWAELRWRMWRGGNRGKSGRAAVVPLHCAKMFEFYLS